MINNRQEEANHVQENRVTYSVQPNTATEIWQRADLLRKGR